MSIPAETRDYLDDLQLKACRLESLLTATADCLDDPELSAVCASMLNAAVSLATKINIGLDASKVPAGGAA